MKSYGRKPSPIRTKGSCRILTKMGEKVLLLQLGNRTLLRLRRWSARLFVPLYLLSTKASELISFDVSSRGQIDNIAAPDGRNSTDARDYQ